ncbi:MAG: DUF4838 domain-containing protein [Planctomycetota bacterium]|jgi:hypothetical protein
MKIQVTILIILIISFLLTCNKSNAEEYIVNDGQPAAAIIVDKNAPRTTKLAAEELQLHIKKISGAELKILNASSSDNLFKIFIGKSKYTDELGIEVKDLKYDAYKIKSGKGYLALVGLDSDFVIKKPYAKNNSDIPRMEKEWDKVTGSTYKNPTQLTYKNFNRDLKIWQQDRRGSLMAVYEYLRMLGVRWYMPGPLGEVIPELKTISVPQINKTVHPEFQLRQMHFAHFHMGSRDHVLWYIRMGLNHLAASIGLNHGSIVHGLQNVQGREEMQKTHPEYYALHGNKRIVDKMRNGLPCMSSEGLFKETINFASKMYDHYGNEMVSVMPQDGYGFPCQCKLCKNKATPERGWFGGMSDYVWEFVDKSGKELLKKYPEKKISCFAYGTYLLPPEKIKKLPKNVVFGIVQNRGLMTKPEKHKFYRESRDNWFAKTSDKVIIWDHYLYTRRKSQYNGLPIYYPHAISEDVKNLKGKSYGEFIEVSFGPGLDLNAPILNHLNVYVTARLYWDIDKDIDELLDEYYKKFYGPAAEAMKTFIDFSEKNFVEMKNSVELLAEGIKLFEKVKESAGDESAYTERINLLAKYLRPMYDLHKRLTSGRKNARKATCLEENGKMAEFKVDGVLTDKLWNRQAPFALLDNEIGELPQQQTTVRFAWKSKSLCISIKCYEKDMVNLNISTTKDDDAEILNGDNIEILIETQVHSYYQIVINPAGTKLDSNRKGGMELKWDSNVKHAVKKEKDHWIVELQIPIAHEDQAEMDPFNGMPGRRAVKTFPYYLNVCRKRVRGDNEELSAFSPTGSLDFHDSTMFGEFYVR